MKMFDLIDFSPRLTEPCSEKFFTAHHATSADQIGDSLTIVN